MGRPWLCWRVPRAACVIGGAVGVSDGRRKRLLDPVRGLRTSGRATVLGVRLPSGILNRAAGRNRRDLARGVDVARTVDGWSEGLGHRVDVAGHPLAQLLEAAVIPGAFLLVRGRLGHFINGQIVGSASPVRWAVIFPGFDEPRHLAPSVTR